MPRSTGLGAYHYIGRSDSLNWRTHIFFAVPAALTGILFDYPRLGGGPAGSWALLIIVSILTPIIVMELLSQLLGKASWTKPKPMVVVWILIIAGLARGLVIFYLGGAFGIVPQEDLLYRLIGGPLYVGASYMVGNYILLASLDHRQISAVLEDERANLKLSKQSFEAQLLNLRIAQMTRVRDLLAPAIWELGKLLKDASLSKDASRAIAALRQLNDEVVRPLSHSMTSQFQLPALTRGLSQRARLGQFVLPARVKLAGIFPVTAFAPFVAVISYSATSALMGPIDALLAAAGSTAVLTVQLLILKVLVRNPEVPLFAATFISLLGGLSLAATTVFMVTSEFLSLPSQIALQSAVFIVLTMLVFLALGVVQMQRNEATRELELAVEDLRLLTSQLRQQVWLSQKTLATELHGSVQAALNASAMRLAQLISPTTEDLDRVRLDIDKAMQRLGDNDYLGGQSIEELLEQICDLWEGSCRIDYRVSNKASSALAEDSAAAYCVLEVIREAVNNGIKHGSANELNIEVDIEGDLILVEVINDGSQSQLSTPGLGSALYQELTHDYKLTFGNRTKLEAKIPLSPVEQQPQP